LTVSDESVTFAYERRTAMNAELVLDLADSRATLAVAGGKGASLAQLAAAGLPVPRGFHVTTAAYRQFVAENELQTAIRAALAPVDPDQPATLETASRAIGAAFAGARMPAAVAAALARAYAGLGASTAVAVRSSATAEDLPGLSFAGQQETYLNVRGAAAVQDAVQRCWASLWTARAIGYRAQHGVDQETVSLAVVVQELVAAEAAGILFTANPLTGARGQAVINAAWGLGEAIVGGQVTPDTLTVDKAGGRVLARETADKQVMTVPVDGGTREQPTPEDLRRRPALGDAAAAELARLGVRIEALYGQPMDIEWTRAGGQFAILQARPITALPEPEALPPSEWPIPNPKGQYMRDSVIELMPDPLTPLFSTLGVQAIERGTQDLFSELGGTKWNKDVIALVNDYAYFDIGVFSGGLMVSFISGALGKLGSLLRTYESRWRDIAHVAYVDSIERWRARPLDAYTAPELLAGIRELTMATVHVYNALQSGVIPMAEVAEICFSAFYDRLVRSHDDPPALVFLVGYDSQPIRAEKALYEQAEWCRARPALAAYLAGAPGARLAIDLTHERPPAGIEEDEWREWRSRFGAYLNQYGHSIYDLDFAKPVPADDPAPLLETCRLFLTGRAPSPYARQQAQVERRERAVEAITARLKGRRLAWFRKLYDWAQHDVPLREDGLADLGLGYPLLRRMAFELGRRLAEAGVFEQPGDIFWLRENEAQELAGALAAGAPLPSRAAAVRERKAVWRGAKRVTPPAVLPPHRTKVFGIDIAGLLPARIETEGARGIKGVAASPGRVTGTARVLHGPEDFDQMRPGDVLVAAVTTPAWTPLFAMAAAIVTDVGGPLSHSSIVAREYGIPAVLGTGVATKRIHSGDVITVDGAAGVVRHA
jgi:phosphohistidine swiveling domain-containing protein